MLIVGAGGMATQLFEDLEAMDCPDVVFWSETETRYDFIREKYPIIKTDEEVREYFSSVSDEFILSVGSIADRQRMTEKFRNLGGRTTTFISPFAMISSHQVQIGVGTTILAKTIIEAGVTIGEGCLLNKISNVAHGCNIAPYCEIGPAVIMTGEVEIGENSSIGTGAIILPKLKIGRNAVIAAGSVITKNIPDYALVAGNPAKVIKVREGKYVS